MRRLVDYVLRNLYREEPGAEPATRLLDLVVQRTAKLAASYMAAGFVHGVLNTDNLNVTGESFDYGPWRFLPTWDAGFTAAYFDHAGLYAFGRQPEAIHWDAMRLAVSLRAISPAEPLIAVLDTFGARYQSAVSDAILWRLGLVSRGSEDNAALVNAVERGLRSDNLQVDRFFLDAFGGALPDTEAFAEARTLAAPYAARKSRTHAYWRDDTPCSMLIGEVEAIWSAIAERDDWSLLHAKVDAIRDMGAALA